MKVRKNVHRKLDSGNPSVTNRASMVAGFSVGCKDWMPSKMPQMYRLAAMHMHKCNAQLSYHFLLLFCHEISPTFLTFQVLGFHRLARNLTWLIAHGRLPLIPHSADFHIANRLLRRVISAFCCIGNRLQCRDEAGGNCRDFVAGRTKVVPPRSYSHNRCSHTTLRGHPCGYRSTDKCRSHRRRRFPPGQVQARWTQHSYWPGCHRRPQN